MGYRGEDVSRTGQGNAGSWAAGAQGYGNEDYDDYASDGTGHGYQQGDGYAGYPQQEQGQYTQHDPYGQQPPYGAPAGYEQPAGYDQPSGYGYQQPTGPAAGYGQADYSQPDYSQPGGSQGYEAPNDGYGQPGGYPARHGGSGSYPAVPDGSDGYQGRDAGNDWYGGQPAAASGASFADTGTYALNGRIIEEYGTGPNETLRNPARGYPPASGQPQDPADDYDHYAGYDGEQYPGRGSTGEFPTTVRNPTGGYPVAGRNPTGEYPTTVGNPTGGYPVAGRNPTGGYPIAGRNPTGEYPTTVGNPTGGYPVAGGDYDAYAPGAYDGREYDGEHDNLTVGYGSAPDDDPYQDRYGRGGGGAKKGGRTKPKKGGAKKSAAGRSGPGLSGAGRSRTLWLALGSVFVVAVACAAAYFLVLKPHPSPPNPNAAGRLPTAGASPSNQPCVQQYGIYCHIELRTLDPTPLTLAELFPPAIDNEANGHTSSTFTLETTKLDTKCSSAVIGKDLITALQAGKCSQVLRASYLSGDGKIMGTIGVVNLGTTVEAHHAGKVVGQNDFIAPLATKKGVASKLGRGTGVVEAEYKGHYLILTWSEFVNGATPKTTAEDNALEQFSAGLVSGTANITLSERMVGTSTSPTPSAGATGRPSSSVSPSSTVSPSSSAS
jgi:hypothetical protein